MRALRSFLVLAILTAVSCAQSDPRSVAERVEEVRRARLAYAAPAAVLGSVVRDAEQQISRVRLGVPPDPGARVRAVAAARRAALERLRVSIADARQLQVDASGPDAGAAAVAWRSAVQAASRLLAVARADLDHTAVLAETDQQLGRIVAGWDAPGSYTAQLRRFAAARSKASALILRLRTRDPRPPCGRSLARRVTAADAVVEASGELRALVAARRGEAFDARRAALAIDPFGVGPSRGVARTALARLDATEASCWRAEGATPSEAARTLDALENLQAALNPSDLRDRSRS